MGKIQNYRKYESSHSNWPLAFLYPENWTVRELVERGSIEIFIAGPRDETGAAVASITVLGEKGKDKPLKQYVEDYINRFRSLNGFNLIARTEGSLNGYEAEEVEITYTMPLPLESINARPTPIRERRIFFKKGECLYELIYSAAEENYFTYLFAFQTLVRTLSTGKQEESYYPLILSLPSVKVSVPKAG